MSVIDVATERPIAIKDVAKRFGVHPRTVDAWRKAGLEWFKMGGLIYTTEEALQRYSQQPTRERERKERTSQRLEEAMRELRKELEL